MKFRVLSYNIHKAIGVDRKFDPSRVVEILRHHDADVALLQEVDRAVPRSGHVDLASYLARELQYRYRAVGMNVFLKKGKYGNATLSRFHIGRQRNIDLTIGKRKRRGAQHTRLDLFSGARHVCIDVFNVHLSLLASLRRRQVQVLLATNDMSELPYNAPCIVAGDMNDWPGQLGKQLFKPAGFECATERRPGSRWSIKTYPSFAPTGGLDKIFYRGAIELDHVHRSRLNVARVASDHLPVIADFVITQLPEKVD